jgi:hypothetical protein
MLHVNPDIKQKGMLVIFNPTQESITRTLLVNLYYTGLTETAKVTGEDGIHRSVAVARDYTAEFDVSVAPGGFAWYVIE